MKSCACWSRPITTSRSPTAGQLVPSWSSDSERAAWRRTWSTTSDAASVRPTTTPSSRWWRSTAAEMSVPSSGKAMAIEVEPTDPPPMPGAKPPAKSCAAARLNGPSGWISNSANCSRELWLNLVDQSRHRFLVVRGRETHDNVAVADLDEGRERGDDLVRRAGRLGRCRSTAPGFGVAIALVDLLEDARRLVVGVADDDRA